MTNHADYVMLLIKRRLRLELVCFQQLVLILVENLVSDDSILIFNYLHHP